MRRKESKKEGISKLEIKKEGQAKKGCEEKKTASEGEKIKDKKGREKAKEIVHADIKPSNIWFIIEKHLLLILVELNFSRQICVLFVNHHSVRHRTRILKVEWATNQTFIALA